jgi:hypothetical protein
LKSGDAFLYPMNSSGLKHHLHIVATDPDENGLVAIASLTSLKGAKDQTVIIRQGEHPFIRWETVVFFAQAFLIEVSAIEEWLSNGDAQSQVAITHTLLSEIQDGFIASDSTKNRVRDFVAAYRERIRPRSAGS